VNPGFFAVITQTAVVSAQATVRPQPLYKNMSYFNHCKHRQDELGFPEKLREPFGAFTIEPWKKKGGP